MGTETPLYSGSSSILGSKQVKKNNPLMGTETYYCRNNLEFVYMYIVKKIIP